VVPNLAMEAHKAAIDRVVDNALAQAGVDASQLDGVAVTVGPGLSLCLRVRLQDGLPVLLVPTLICFVTAKRHKRARTHTQIHIHTHTNTHTLSGGRG